MELFPAVLRAWIIQQKNLLLALFAFVALALLGSSVHTWLSERQRQQQSLYAQQVASFQRQATHAVAVSDSLRGVVRVRETTIQRLTREVASLRRKLPDTATIDSLKMVVDSLYTTMSDSVKHAYAIIPLQHTVIQQQDSVIHIHVLTIVRQDTLLRLKDSTIVDLRQANDTLTAALRRPIPRPKPERFLGILPLPSRRTSAVVGFVVGVVGTVRVLR